MDVYQVVILLHFIKVFVEGKLVFLALVKKFPSDAKAMTDGIILMNQNPPQWTHPSPSADKH